MKTLIAAAAAYLLIGCFVGYYGARISLRDHADKPASYHVQSALLAGALWPITGWFVLWGWKGD